MTGSEAGARKVHDDGRCERSRCLSIVKQASRSVPKICLTTKSPTLHGKTLGCTVHKRKSRWRVARRESKTRQEIQKLTTTKCDAVIEMLHKFTRRAASCELL